MAQKLWFIINIKKDKQEHSEELKILCTHICPEAYFKKNKEVATDFLSDIENKLGRALSAEEKMALGNESVTFNQLEEEDLDIIERV